MKRWKGLLIAAVCIVGSCYVGDVGAANMSCQVAFGQESRAQGTPGKLELDKIQNPDMKRFLEDCVGAAHKPVVNYDVNPDVVSVPANEVALIGKVHDNIISAVKDGASAKRLIDNALAFEVSSGNTDANTADAAKGELYMIFDVRN